MLNENGIRLIGVERAVSHISHVEGLKRAPWIEHQRLREQLRPDRGRHPGAATGQRNRGFAIAVKDDFLVGGAMGRASLLRPGRLACQFTASPPFDFAPAAPYQ